MGCITLPLPARPLRHSVAIYPPAENTTKTLKPVQTVSSYTRSGHAEQVRGIGVG